LDLQARGIHNRTLSNITDASLSMGGMGVFDTFDRGVIRDSSPLGRLPQKSI